MKKENEGSFKEKKKIDKERKIMVLDRGIGGLKVLREERVVMKERRLVYIEEDEGFKYGKWEEEEMKRRIIEMFGELIENYEKEIEVIECNKD